MDSQPNQWVAMGRRVFHLLGFSRAPLTKEAAPRCFSTGPGKGLQRQRISHGISGMLFLVLGRRESVLDRRSRGDACVWSNRKTGADENRLS